MGTRTGNDTGGCLLRNGSWFFVDNGWATTGKTIANNITANTWQHIACSFDNTNNTIRIFRNGILQGSQLFNYVNTQSVVSLFAAINGANQTDNMYIDSFRLTRACRYINNFNPETDTYLAY